MKLIPEEKRYARRCYFCHRSHLPENPVAFELDIEETEEYKSVAKAECFVVCIGGYMDKFDILYK